MNYRINLIISFFSTIPLIIGIVQAKENILLSPKKRKLFYHLSIWILLEVLVDNIIMIATFATFTTFATFATSIKNTFAPIIIFLFAKLVSHYDYWETNKRKFLLLFIANTILQLIFSFYSSLISAILLYIIIMIALFMFWRCTKHTFVQNNNNTITLVFTIVFYLGSLIVRNLFNLNVDWLCVAFCYNIFFSKFLELYLKLDPLSKLLTRRAYESRIENITGTTAVIFIDINNLKRINDNQGHKNGDLAISDFSRIIKKVFENYSDIFRYGGDEICIIFHEKWFNSVVNPKHEIEDLLDILVSSCKYEAQRKTHLKYGVAYGYSIIKYPNDKKITRRPLDPNMVRSAVKAADSKMYKMKRMMKNKM